MRKLSFGYPMAFPFLAKFILEYLDPVLQLLDLMANCLPKLLENVLLVNY
jgi:hypothetical protein